MKNTAAFLLLFFYACATSKNVSVLSIATPLPPGTPVEVIGVGQKVPDGSKMLGHIKIGDSGFSTKCTYDIVIADAQAQSRAIGGNLIQITKHKPPAWGGTCHMVECDVYLKK